MNADIETIQCNTTGVCCDYLGLGKWFMYRMLREDFDEIQKSIEARNRCPFTKQELGRMWSGVKNVSKEEQTVHLHKKWFVECFHALYEGYTRVGPFETLESAKAAIPAIKTKGMYDEDLQRRFGSWDDVDAREMYCIAIDEKWYTLHLVENPASVCE
jgi:hypothetical protein